MTDQTSAHHLRRNKTSWSNVHLLDTSITHLSNTRSNDGSFAYFIISFLHAFSPLFFIEMNFLDIYSLVTTILVLTGGATQSYLKPHKVKSHEIRGLKFIPI